MRKLLIFGLAGAFAGQALSQTPVYAPVRSIRDQGITVRGWGSGTISETDELAYEGTYSIRISTRNFFQGGILSFANPVDLSAAYGNKNNLLRVLIRVADASMTLGGGGGPGRGGGRGGDDLGGAGGGAPGQGLGGQPGRPGGGLSSTTAQPDTTLRNIRVILTTSDGKKSEAYVPVNTSGSGDRGWHGVAIPLQAVNGFGETNKMVKEVAISGDATTTFYVGDMKIVNDSTPIQGDTNYHEMNVANGDEVEFSAIGFGGSSVLKYSWDFNDKDGIQNDAEGQVVKHRFRREGAFTDKVVYTVTVTISDHFGLKTPLRKTIKVTVNP